MSKDLRGAVVQSCTAWWSHVRERLVLAVFDIAEGDIRTRHLLSPALLCQRATTMLCE